MARQWSIFINSIFFVLGFSFVFSLVGVLLQSVLLSHAYSVQKYLSWIGGLMIIFFGLYLAGLVKIGYLERERKLHLKRRFRFSYITSFAFGSAFAVGWTPCVGAVLGAILTLAVTNPGNAFWLMLSYSLGLGIPFLAAGLFTNQVTNLIARSGPKLRYVNILFGVLLIAIGIFVFTRTLGRLANFGLAARVLGSHGVFSLNLGAGASLDFVSLAIAFIAGTVSFLSPCILPLVPGYLSYLGATATFEARDNSSNAKSKR